MGRAVHFVVMGCGAASFVCVLVLFFFTASDPGLAVYTAKPFTDWGALADTLQASGNVSCVPATDWPRNASTLQALLETAWCTEGVWPPGSNPTNRSAACACVTAAWDGLVRAACGPMNRSVVRPSPEALSGARGQVLGCMALPPQYRVGQLGDLLSSVRPTGLAMYCNAVLCLACASFVLFFFFGFTTFWIWVWMSMVFAVLSVMLVQQVMAQLLVLPSLFLAFVSVVLGLDDEREAGQGSDVTDITDELEICSYCILPQLLPAYAVLMAVSGVGREVGAWATFAALGLFMGVSLQWLRMAGRTRADPARLALLGPGEWSFWGSCSEAVYNAGLGCLAVHWLHLLVLGLTYYAPDSPLLLSRAWAWILVSMLAALCGFCALDARSLLDPSVESERRGLSTCRVLVMLVGCNVLLTGMACHDARLA